MAARPETCVIIGLGQIGGSLALALRKAEFCAAVGGYDVSEAVRETARLHLDFVCENEYEAFADADVVVLATPVHTILKQLHYGFQAFSERLYLDCGSAKQPMIRLANQYRAVRFVGGHPLAGTEKSGITGWDPGLFSKKPFFVVPSAQSKEEDVRFFKELIASIGAIPVEVEASEHDRALAVTSHLPLLVSLALTELFSTSGKELRDYIGPGLQSMTRLSGGSPEMGTDVLLANREEILSELSRFAGILNLLAELLQSERKEALLAKLRSLQQDYWEIIARGDYS